MDTGKAFWTTRTRVCMLSPSPSPSSARQPMVSQAESSALSVDSSTSAAAMSRMPVSGYFLYLPVRETMKPTSVDDTSMVPIIGTIISPATVARSEEHTSELQSRFDLVCRLLLEKENKYIIL